LHSAGYAFAIGTTPQPAALLLDLPGTKAYVRYPFFGKRIAETPISGRYPFGAAKSGRPPAVTLRKNPHPPFSTPGAGKNIAYQRLMGTAIISPF
jgi:hypothetical protein